MLAGFFQGLEESSNTVLGHGNGFFVGLALRDATRKRRDRHHVTAFLSGLEVHGVGMSLHNGNDNTARSSPESCHAPPSRNGREGRSHISCSGSASKRLRRWRRSGGGP